MSLLDAKHGNMAQNATLTKDVNGISSLERAPFPKVTSRNLRS